jgi:hypothetical protein
MRFLADSLLVPQARMADSTGYTLDMSRLKQQLYQK